MHPSILELPPVTSGPCSIRYTTDLITESNSLHRDTQQPSERFTSSEDKKLIVAGHWRAVSASPLKGHYTLRDQPRVEKAVMDHLQPGSAAARSLGACRSNVLRVAPGCSARPGRPFLFVPLTAPDSC